MPKTCMRKIIKYSERAYKSPKQGAKMVVRVEQQKSPPKTTYIYENITKTTLPKIETRGHRSTSRTHPHLQELSAS